MIAFVVIAGMAGLAGLALQRQQAAKGTGSSVAALTPTLEQLSVEELRVAHPEIARALGTRRVQPHFYVAALSSGTHVAIGVEPGQEWVDVYARQRRRGDRAGRGSGDYDQFGYDLHHDGWSYGDGPPHAREIRALIAAIR